MILIEEERFGFLLQLNNFVVVFGNRHFQIEDIKRMYPRFQFFGLKQVHSDKIHNYASNDVEGATEADSIICDEANVATYVRTADCAPVFIADRASGSMAAIHAGWRGVANGIVPKTILRLSQKLNVEPSRFDVLVGPHIQKESFEVDADVRDQLLNSVAQFTSELVTSSASKYLVDLHLLLKIQIQDCGIHAEKVNSLLIDTKKNMDFHSYRRDREKSGRQISFIARLI